MVDPMPAEAAEQAGFVLVMWAIGAVNLAASLTLIFFRWQLTWWLVVGFQGALFLFVVVEGIQTDPQGWFGFSSLPMATLLLLVGLPLVNAKLRPSIAEIAT